MLSVCIYEEMKMEKSWAFGFCPLLSFALNVCPGFAVPLHIVLPWTCRALFSVLTYRGIIGRLCVSHKPSQGCHGNRLDTSTHF